MYTILPVHSCDATVVKLRIGMEICATFIIILKFWFVLIDRNVFFKILCVLLLLQQTLVVVCVANSGGGAGGWACEWVRRQLGGHAL